jgi:hypothetical protein
VYNERTPRIVVAAAILCTGDTFAGGYIQSAAMLIERVVVAGTVAASADIAGAVAAAVDIHTVQDWHRQR